MLISYKREAQFLKNANYKRYFNEVTYWIYNATKSYHIFSYLSTQYSDVVFRLQELQIHLCALQ